MYQSSCCEKRGCCRCSDRAAFRCYTTSGGCSSGLVRVGLRFLIRLSMEAVDPVECARCRPAVRAGIRGDDDDSGDDDSASSLWFPTSGTLLGLVARPIVLPRSKSCNSWSSLWPLPSPSSQYGPRRADKGELDSSQSYPRTTFFIPLGYHTANGRNQCHVGWGVSPPNTCCKGERGQIRTIRREREHKA